MLTNALFGILIGILLSVSSMANRFLPFVCLYVTMMIMIVELWQLFKMVNKPESIDIYRKIFKDSFDQLAFGMFLILSLSIFGILIPTFPKTVITFTIGS